MLYRYGLNLGLKLLPYGKVKQALPYLIRPVNYWRAAEYKAVLAEAEFHAGDRILDIGSPKLLAIYLADKLHAEVYATDIEDYFIRRLQVIRRMQHIPASRLRAQVEDGRCLRFAANFFQKVYSISVLEHIPDDGDTICVQEMGRVLAPGGRAVITLPFSRRSKTEYKADFYWSKSSTPDESGKIFYQRRYSETDIYQRIITPSGLRLKRLGYIGETIMAASQRELSEFLPAISGPVQPLLSRLFHTQIVDSITELKKPLCAVIVLEK